MLFFLKKGTLLTEQTVYREQIPTKEEIRGTAAPDPDINCSSFTMQTKINIKFPTKYIVICIHENNFKEVFQIYTFPYDIT